MLKTTVNGIQLAYERRGNGFPLVLIHGYPLDHFIWERVVPILENDFDLILPDLRGFGQSDVVLTPFEVADMAEDIAVLLDLLKIEKAAIAGHSMGGYVALAFGQRHPARLLGMGLVASQVFADAPEKKIGRAREAEDILAHGIGNVAETMSIKLTDDPILQSRLKGIILQQRPQGLAGALLAMAGRPDSTPFLPGLDIPFVVVHGQVDKLIPVERARAIKGLLKKGFLSEIEGAGHMPMMEAPQVTAEALIKIK
jgi:pimeloyl-ACP methyl ester carboxylesterase